MSYNDNDNDNSYGSSGRQGTTGGYGDDRIGGDSARNPDGSYGSSRNEGLGDSSYGSSNRTGGDDSYGSSNTYGSSGRTGGDSYGSSGDYNDNRNLTEKAKDKLSSDRTDRPDDPVSGTNYGQSDSYGSGTGSGGYGGDSSSYGGNDNRGVTDKARDKLSSDRSDRPDNPVTGRNFDQDTSSSGYGGNTTTYGDSSYGGNDNRGLADKAKDKLSSDRSDRPDNPVTGRNFDQDTSSSGYGGNNNSSSYGSGNDNDNRGIGEKIKDKLSSKRSDQPDDPISGTNYGEDNSRGSSGGGLMDKVKAKIGGSGNNRNDNDSYGSSGNTYGGSDSYGSGNNDRNY